MVIATRRSLFILISRSEGNKEAKDAERSEGVKKTKSELLLGF